MGRIRDQWSTAAWVSAAISAVAGVALVITALATVDDHRQAVVVFGVAASVALAGGLITGFAPAVWLAVALLAAMATLADAPGAPLVAAGLFVVAEAGSSAATERFTRCQDRSVYSARLLLLGVVVASSIVVGAGMRLVARDNADRGSSYTVIAALATVGLLVLLVARTRTGARSATAE